MNKKIHLHIPKTSGVSIKYTNAAYSTLSLGLFVPARAISTPLSMFTVVRDPVDRMWSLWNHALRGCSEFWRLTCQTEQLNFDRFLDIMDSVVPLPYSTTYDSTHGSIDENKSILFGTTLTYDNLPYARGVSCSRTDEATRFGVDYMKLAWSVTAPPTKMGFDPVTLVAPDIKVPRLADGTYLDFNVMGHCVASQWDYIKNDVGHNIDIFYLERDQEALAEYLGVSEVPWYNIGNPFFDKETILTASRIERIRRMCQDDYINLDFD